jgi:hypothetical protein
MYVLGHGGRATHLMSSLNSLDPLSSCNCIRRYLFPSLDTFSLLRRASLTVVQLSRGRCDDFLVDLHTRTFFHPPQDEA